MAEMVRRGGAPGGTELALRSAEGTEVPGPQQPLRQGVPSRGNSARSCRLWARPWRVTPSLPHIDMLQGEGPFYAR